MTESSAGHPVWDTLNATLGAEVTHIARVFWWSLPPMLFTIVWFQFVFYIQQQVMYVKKNNLFNVFLTFSA